MNYRTSRVSESSIITAWTSRFVGRDDVIRWHQANRFYQSSESSICGVYQGNMRETRNASLQVGGRLPLKYLIRRSGSPGPNSSSYDDAGTTYISSLFPSCLAFHFPASMASIFLDDSSDRIVYGGGTWVVNIDARYFGGGAHWPGFSADGGVDSGVYGSIKVAFQGAPMSCLQSKSSTLHI